MCSINRNSDVNVHVYIATIEALMKGYCLSVWLAQARLNYLDVVVRERGLRGMGTGL